MPDQSTNSNLKPKGDPHTLPWYWRLLNLFQREQHPFNFDVDGIEDDKAAKNTQTWWDNQFKIGSDRKERYRIFDEMDSGLVAAILDLYAEEITQIDYEKNKAVWVESKNPAMVTAGEECLRNCMIEDKITPIVRRFLKYGDGFQRLIYQTGKGVLGWRHGKTDAIYRLEDKYTRLIGFREDGHKYRGERKHNISWPWDYIHFRVLGKDEESGYGTGILDAMFNPWRQLVLMEDAVLMYRLRRAPDRNMIMVDVGNMEEAEALEYVNAWRKRFRKHELVDPASPNYKKQYNPLTPLEDIFMPIRGAENNSRIETLSGSGVADQLFDLNYYRDKFFGAAKVPKAYMGFEGDVNAKATLLQQDIRFARTAKRGRKAAIYGLRQLLDIHFTLLPTDPKDKKYEFTRPENAYLVQMSPISFLDEFDRLELVQLRYQIIEAMANMATTMQIDVKVWATYILLNYAKLPEDLVMKLISQTPSGPPGAGAGGGGGGGFPQGGGSEIGSFGGTGGETAPAAIPGESHKRPVWLQITETIGTKGFYQLSNAEKLAIAKAMHESSALRQIVGDIAETHVDDKALAQTDESLLPVRRNGIRLEDSVSDDAEAKQLREDLASLEKGWKP